jgi:hypothetical protein
LEKNFPSSTSDFLLIPEAVPDHEGWMRPVGAEPVGQVKIGGTNQSRTFESHRFGAHPSLLGAAHRGPNNTPNPVKSGPQFIKLPEPSCCLGNRRFKPS